MGWTVGGRTVSAGVVGLPRAHGVRLADIGAAAFGG